MDNTTDLIATFASDLEYDAISSGAVAAVKRHHLDGIGCAAGAFASEPCVIARSIAGTASNHAGASAYGVPEKTTPEYAAFANGSANRLLDYNDTYLTPSGGHPNDAAPAVLAAVELIGGSGRDVILGNFLVYEIFAALADAHPPMRDQGWDQGAFIGVAIAAAIGRLLGLDSEQLGNAISLALVPNMPMRVVRAGEISHWKGCATAHAAMNALWAVRLAQAGMTGPAEPFEGVDALWRFTGPFALEGLGGAPDGKHAVERTWLKYFPTEGTSQALVGAFVDLHEQVDPARVASIDIDTSHLSWHEIGGGQGDAAMKWDPQTRETADHSLPYLVAVALVDGAVTLDSFRSERVTDPALRPLMNKIRVTPNEEFERRLRSAAMEQPSRIRIELDTGETIDREVNFPRGHPANPMSDAEVESKFLTMAPAVMAESAARSLMSALWNLDSLDRLDELTANFRAWNTA